MIIILLLTKLNNDFNFNVIIIIGTVMMIPFLLPSGELVQNRKIPVGQ